MHVTLNGTPIVVKEETVLVADFLKLQGVKNLDMVAVQINGEFASKESLVKSLLKEGDCVDFVYFMGGGF